MRATKIMLLTLCGVGVVGALGILILLRTGLTAREEPSALEARMARLARTIAMPRAAKVSKNPHSNDAEISSDVKSHYAQHCAECHGPDGSGNTVFGRNMYPRVPDLKRKETQELTDGELYYIIANGIRFTGMPGFAGEEETDEIWKLVPLLRRLPLQSSEEVRELEEMSHQREPTQGTEAPGETQSSEHMHE